MKLFKNANLVNIEKESVSLVDILVDEQGKIFQVGKGLKCNGEVPDLGGDYVLPPFVIGFGNIHIILR